MTNNERMVKAAWEVIHRYKDSQYVKESGWCMAVARLVIERAFDLPSYSLYERYVTERVESDDQVSRHWWARDAERSLRNLGMSVPLEDVQPGDILFKYDAARRLRDRVFIGHVGIMVAPGVIFENINIRYRPQVYMRNGCLVLTPYEHWPAPTTCIRFDPDKRVG